RAAPGARTPAWHQKLGPAPSQPALHACHSVPSGTASRTDRLARLRLLRFLTRNTSAAWWPLVTVAGSTRVVSSRVWRELGAMGSDGGSFPAHTADHSEV